MQQEVINALKSLYADAIDAHGRYQQAVDAARNQAMIPLFSRMMSLHAKNADELRLELLTNGQKSGESGSVMDTVHRPVASARPPFGGAAEPTLPGLLDGEQRIVARFNAALAQRDITSYLRIRLTIQKERILNQTSKMKINYAINNPSTIRRKLRNSPER